MRPTLRRCGPGFAIVLFLLAQAACLTAQAPEWKPFSNTADGFKALFPSEPEVSKSDIPEGGNTFVLHSYVAESGTSAIYVGVCDYGAKGAGSDPETLLASAKNGAVSGMKAHLVTEKKISLGSSNGVAFEAESDKFHFTIRMYVSGAVLYQTMVATPLGEKFADTTRFLDSFQITPRPVSEAVATPAAKPAVWKPYQFPADGFSASFPSEPKLEKQPVATAAGSVDYHSYTIDDGATTLIAGITDFGSVMAGKDPETILQGAKNGAVTNSKGRLVSEKPITLGANHGIAFEIETDSAYVTARVYMVGTSIYELIVASPAKSNYADTTRFLDSLKLIDRPAK